MTQLGEEIYLLQAAPQQCAEVGLPIGPSQTLSVSGSEFTDISRWRLSIEQSVEAEEEVRRGQLPGSRHARQAEGRRVHQPGLPPLERRRHQVRHRESRAEARGRGLRHPHRPRGGGRQRLRHEGRHGQHGEEGVRQGPGEDREA